MAFAHPRSQTVVVSVACIAIIAIAVLWSNQSKVSGQNSATLSDEKVIATIDNVDQIGSSTDWKKAFVTGNVSTAGAKTATSATTSQEDQTMTAYMGKATLASLLALQQAGLDGDQTAMDQATQNVASATMAYKTPITYNQSDLNITVMSDDITLNTFKADVAHSLSLYNTTRSEALITRQSIDDKNPELLKQIDPIIKNYQQIIDSLKKVKTPSVLSSQMLDLINGFSMMKFVAEAMRASSNDPLFAVVGINDYLTGAGQIYDSLISMRQYIESRGGKFVFNGHFMTVMLSNN